VISERPLREEILARVDIALQHEVRLGGHLEIDRLAAHVLDGLAAQEPGEHPLVDAVRQRRGRRVGERGIAAERDRDLEAFAELLRAAEVARPGLVDLPVHRGGAAVDALHPVHPDVAGTGVGILGDDVGQREERSAVCRPARHHGERHEIDVVTERDHLLASGARDPPRNGGSERRQLARHLGELARALRGARVDELLDGARVVLEIFDAERARHATPRAVRIDEERKPRALHVLEEEGRPARLHRPIGDLGDLEVGIDLAPHTHELGHACRCELALERLHESSQPVVRHGLDLQRSFK
jgi:hypothetical protein